MKALISLSDSRCDGICRHSFPYQLLFSKEPRLVLHSCHCGPSDCASALVGTAYRLGPMCCCRRLRAIVPFPAMPHAASHAESAALGPPAEAASLSHSDGPSLRPCAWPGAASAPAWPARLLVGGPAGAGEAALSAEKKTRTRRPGTGSRLFYISSCQWAIMYWPQSTDHPKNP
jgi:hypothetical protein